MTSTTCLENAIHELAAAKQLAEQFNWPKETIDRIDLLMRASAKVRSEMLRRHESGTVGTENDSRMPSPDAA